MRALRARRTRNGLARVRTTVACGSIGAMLALAGVAAPAAANDYPSWDDVQNAKSNEASVQSAVTTITALISNLHSEVTLAEELAHQRGAEFSSALDNFDLADQRAQQLEQQAEASKKEATEATVKAGRVAARLYRASGSDLLVMNLLIDDKAEEDGQLLAKLGRMSKLVERHGSVYRTALAAKNTAESLGAQAEVARSERERLQRESQNAMNQAVAAQEASATKFAEQQSKGIELEQQLRALQDTTTTVVAGYRDGQEVQQQQAAAAEAAAARASSSESSGRRGSPGPSLGGGFVSDGGWAVPASGRITDSFGPRQSVCARGMCSGTFHRGTDIGTGFGAPIYAAHSGTVRFAGWSGAYGNFILIDHGDGVTTGYAHIQSGGILVPPGKSVSAGEIIAFTGSTGLSTDPHLHYEVRVNDRAVDAATFMAERGAPLG